MSNTQILQVGPRQTDGEGSPAFCQNLALTFSPALKMVQSFNVQIGNFTAKATGETSINRPSFSAGKPAVPTPGKSLEMNI